MIQSARVRVPATTANLGPGFDALGLALKLYNTTTVLRSSDVPTDTMAKEASAAFFEASGIDPFGFDWVIDGDVPRSRGLGSSVTVRLGILHGLNALAGAPLDAVSIYRLCATLEGHPDNAAPAAFGGFTVARHDQSWQQFRVSDALTFVLLIPDFEVETPAARGVLPSMIPFADAVRSASNAAAIAAGFASQNYLSLRGCFADGLHQPYRSKLIPRLDSVIGAAETAGAVGGWLSGSGSTIAALLVGDPSAVVDAMSKAYGSAPHAMLAIGADNQGVQILHDGNDVA
jgi:homoserine kinase